LLFVVAEHGQFAFLKWLIQEKKAAVDVKDGKQATLLHYAVQSGRLDMVQWLVEECHLDVHAKDREDKTLIHVITSQGQDKNNENLEAVKLVQWLVEQGVDPQAESKYGTRALDYAVNHGHWAIVMCLVEVGIDANTERVGKFVIEAAAAGRCDVIEFLLNHGASVDIRKDDYHNTPLHSALSLGQWQVAKLLIERGADVTLQVKDYYPHVKTTLDCLKEGSWERKKESLKIVEELEAMIQAKLHAAAGTSEVGMFSEFESKDKVKESSKKMPAKRSGPG